MRRLVVALLTLSLSPNAPVWSQEPSNPSVVPAQLADEDVVPAAELEAAMVELETAYAQHHNTLLAVIDQAPEAARPALEQALEKSKLGYYKARANRERTTAMRQEKATARLAKSQGRGGQANQGQFGSRPLQAGQVPAQAISGPTRGQGQARAAQAPESQGGPTTTGSQQNQGRGSARR